MRHQVILLCLLLAMSAEAQEATAPSTLRADEAIDTRTLERIQIPVAATPSRTILVNPEVVKESVPAADGAPSAGQSQTTDSVTVDLKAVRRRIGTVSDIRLIREGQTVAPSPGASGIVTLKRGDILAVRRDQVVRPVSEPAGVTTAASSTILYTLDASGRTRELGLVHRSAGLHWRADHARFEGELLMGILDRENPQAREALEGITIPVQLLAVPGSLGRTDLELTRIGQPFEPVTVTTMDSSEDPFRIEIVSQLDPDLPRAALPVFRPRVALSAPETVPGLGLGQAEVIVSGANLRPGETIILNLDNGWIADRPLVVDKSGTAKTRIRSSGLGGGKLSLASAIYQGGPKEIDYTVPVGFTVATLIGSMLGAVVLVYMLKRKEAGSGRSYKMDWIIGVITGSGATTMAYAGMKLPQWIPLPQAFVGEAAPFALAFICAAAGTALIHSISGAARQPATG